MEVLEYEDDRSPLARAARASRGCPPSVRAWRRSGAVWPPLHAVGRLRRQTGARSGRRRTTSGRRRAEQVRAARRAATPRRVDRRPDDRRRTVRRRGRARPVARRTVIGLAEGVHPGQRLVDEAGDADAGGPVEQDDRPRLGRRRPSSSAAARRANASSRPTKRALVVAGGHGGILRAASARLAVP